MFLPLAKGTDISRGCCRLKLPDALRYLLACARILAFIPGIASPVLDNGSQERISPQYRAFDSQKVFPAVLRRHWPYRPFWRIDWKITKLPETMLKQYRYVATVSVVVFHFPVQEYVMRIGERIEVLGNGFIELRDVMGSDDSIADDARASYGVGTKRKSDNEALIDRLMRDRHTSPFEMAEMKFLVKCPIFVARQWFRHRTGSYNEYSMRYSEPMEDECYIPEPDEWRVQSKTNKQGSDGFLSQSEGAGLTVQYGSVEDRAFGAYRNAIASGVSREQARVCLPVGTFTQFVFKSDLHNLLHFLSLRKKKDAQQEIRVYAHLISEAVQLYFPATYRSWTNHVFHTFKLSARETAAIIAKDWDGTKTFVDDKERERYIEKVKYLGLGGV